MKVLIANRVGANDNLLSDIFAELEEYDCYTLNIPYQFLYETSKDIDPDVFILNKGYEGYDGIRLVRQIRTHKPDAIVIMLTGDSSSTLHPELNTLKGDRLVRLTDINRLLKIYNRIKWQTQPGLKYYERKWCFFRLDISSVQYLLVNLLNNSSLPKANQRIMAAAV